MTEPTPLDSSTPPGNTPDFDEAAEVIAVAEALDVLLDDDQALPDLEHAVEHGDTRAFLQILERNQLLDQLAVVCRWVCSWYVQRRCLWLCRNSELVAMSPEEGREATILFARLTGVDGALEKLVEALDNDDDATFQDLLAQFGLQRYCRFVCVLILTVRCELFCVGLATTKDKRPRGLVATLRSLSSATATIAEDEQSFSTVLRAYETGQFSALHEVLGKLHLVRYCHLVCWWLCVLVPYLRCTRICLELGPIEIEKLPRPGDPGPIIEWAKVTVALARPERLPLLLDPLLSHDDPAYLEAIRKLELAPWCHYICWWFLRLRCYRYCWLVCPPRPPLPYFYKLGGYDYTSEVDAGPGGGGLTLADSRAFYSTVRLNGSPLQKSYDGGVPEYRFEVFQGGSWKPVLAGQIAPTAIGSFTQAGLITPKTYVVNGTGGPNEIPVLVKAGGWIEVPTANNYWGAEGYFGPTGDYLRLDTTTIVPPKVHDASTVNGGDPVPATELGSDEVVSIRMRWRKVGDLSDGLITGTASSVAVCNDRFDQVAKKGKWVPTRLDGQLGVVSLDIMELVTGCDEITNQLHVLYTASHPNLGALTLTLDGPGGFTLTMTDNGASTADNRFGQAEVSAPYTAADLKKCTYIATLYAQILLTTGDSSPLDVTDQIGFHKS
jgi:hypothetical protein